MFFISTAGESKFNYLIFLYLCWEGVFRVNRGYDFFEEGKFVGCARCGNLERFVLEGNEGKRICAGRRGIREGRGDCARRGNAGFWGRGYVLGEGILAGGF